MRSNERQILERHRGWLLKTAKGISVIEGVAGVDDLAQEGWIAMWRAYQSYNMLRGPLDMWLKAHARWRMKTVIRDRTRILEDATQKEDLPEFAIEALADIEFSYHNGEIMDAINRLTPRQREYVFHRFWLGHTDSDMKSHFGYYPAGLWYSKRNGARIKLAKDLAHLTERS